MVEIIWSYNQYNFYFWLQVYSAYSVYNCLSAILHNKYEKFIPIMFLLVSIFLSRFIHFVVRQVSSGASPFETMPELSMRQFDGT